MKKGRTTFNANKKPSIPGRGQLGQHKLGKRRADSKYIKNVHIMYRKRSGPVTTMPTPREFYEAEIESLTEYRENWAWGLCPFHPDGKPSMVINLESGWFCCKSCGTSGNNIVSFVRQLHELDTADALAYLEERI